MDVSESVEIWSTQSGTFLYEIPCTAGTWGMGGSSPFSHTVPLMETGLTRDEHRDLFRPWDNSVVHKINGVPVYAAPIAQKTYRPASRTLEVQHVDMWSIFHRRHLSGVVFRPSDVFPMRRLSLRGIVREAVRYGALVEYSSAWPLPINLPALEAGNQDRDFFMYDMQTIAQIVDTESNAPGGPDYVLQPAIRGNRLSWDLVLGNPFLSGPTFESPVTGEGGLTDVVVTENADNQATGIIMVGRGSEEDIRYGTAANSVTAGISKDYVNTDHTDVDDKDRLNGLARAELDSMQSERVQWSFGGMFDAVDPTTVRLGSTVRALADADDPWLSPGYQEHRVIGYSGALGSQVLGLEIEEV